MSIVSTPRGMMRTRVLAVEEVSLLSRAVHRADDEQPDSEGGPVTVTVARRVTPGREREFEDWYDGIIGAASRQSGFLGAGILHPHTAGHDWHVVYRFADAATLRDWEASAERARWLEEVDELIEEETGVQRVSGLETWFAMPGRTAPAPPRWKMFLVTLAAIVPLVLLMNVAVLPAISEWPLVARTLVFSGTLTGLMTWVVMPRMTRLLRQFLYGRHRPRERR